MLKIWLGTCGCDPRVVDKTSYATLNDDKDCEVYHECSIMNPVFKLKYFSSIVNYNYCYIPDWHRYYNIVDMTMAPGGVCYITCQEDVLMSNKAAILELDVQVKRNEKKRNKLIVDDRYPAEIMSTLGVFNFEDKFDMESGYNIVMTVLGGELVPPSGGD